MHDIWFFTTSLEDPTFKNIFQICSEIATLGFDYRVNEPREISQAGLICGGEIMAANVDPERDQHTMLFFPGEHLSWCLNAVGLLPKIRGVSLAIVYDTLETETSKLGITPMKYEILLEVLGGIKEGYSHSAEASVIDPIDWKGFLELVPKGFLVFFSKLLARKVSHSQKVYVVSSNLSFLRDMKEALTQEGYEVTLFKHIDDALRKIVSRGALGMALQSIGSHELREKLSEVDESLRLRIVVTLAHYPDSASVVSTISEAPIDLLTQILDWLEGRGPLNGWVSQTELEELALLNLATFTSPSEIHLPLVALGSEFLEVLKDVPLPVVPVSDIRRGTNDLIQLYQDQINSYKNVRRCVRAIRRREGFTI